MGSIILECAILGAIGFALTSAVSVIRQKHRRGVFFGISSVVSYMLFVWLWYSSFAQHSRTWLELAFRPGTSAYKENMTFLVCGLLLILANVLGVIRQKRLNLSAPIDTH